MYLQLRKLLACPEVPKNVVETFLYWTSEKVFHFYLGFSGCELVRNKQHNIL